jgi:2-methylisocitrate lyase-like PEP mutase family enzyme
MANSKSKAMRHLIERDEIFVMPSAGIPLHAKMIEAAGYEAVSIAGAMAVSHFLGLPDTGFVTMTEMVENVRRVCDVVNIPVFTDGDTGFGNAINTRRTVQQMIKAGASGIHIEDQVAPKRCGFTKGKEVISEEEAVGKYRAAVDAKNELDKDFIIMARTDARTAAGGSLKEAIRRAKAYREKAGVDIIYMEALQSREEMKEARVALDCPMVCSTTAIKPSPTIAELQEMGMNMAFGIMIANVGNAAMWDMLIATKEHGPDVCDEWIEKHLDHPMVFPNFFDLVGFPEVQALEKKYLPAEAMAKYEKSQGLYDPRTRRNP